MKNEFLRHTLATIKYRFEQSLATRNENFGEFTLGSGSRTPAEIINHMHHVLYSTRIYIEQGFNGEQPKPLDFEHEIERFNNELFKIDAILDVNELPVDYSKKLLQGPLSDILTHIGQISMMQRLHGNPIGGEDFSVASIQTGMKK